MCLAKAGAWCPQGRVTRCELRQPLLCSRFWSPRRGKLCYCHFAKTSRTVESGLVYLPTESLPRVHYPGYKLWFKNSAYGQNSALWYVSDSKVPILHHVSKFIPWVLLPWVQVYTMSLNRYHQSKSIPWIQVYTMSLSPYHDSKSIPWRKGYLNVKVWQKLPQGTRLAKGI